MLPKPMPKGLGEEIILTKILSRAGMFAGIRWAGEEASNDRLSESEPVRIPEVRIALKLISLPISTWHLSAEVLVQTVSALLVRPVRA
jgi:hypothetical protein